MGYKDKIFGYKATSDRDESWLAMENLLDNAKSPVANVPDPINSHWAYKALLFLLLIVFVSIVSYFYFNKENIVNLRTKISPNSNLSNSSSIKVDNISDIKLNKDNFESVVKDSSFSDNHSIYKHNKINDLDSFFQVVQFPNRKLSSSSSSSFNNRNPYITNKNILSIPGSSFLSKKDNQARKIDTSVLNVSNNNISLNVISREYLDKNTANNKISKLNLLPVLTGLELDYSSDIAMNAPSFIKPFEPYKYMIGIELGNVSYFGKFSGIEYSIIGLYELYPWLKVGASASHVNLIEQKSYTVKPNIKNQRVETRMLLNIQIIPIRLWKVSIGIETGLGYLSHNRISRVITNPEPNTINVYSESQKAHDFGASYGAFLTFDISERVVLGGVVRMDLYDNIHYSGRIHYRF